MVMRRKIRRKSASELQMLRNNRLSLKIDEQRENNRKLRVRLRKLKLRLQRK